jgi:G3E family GTPase
MDAILIGGFLGSGKTTAIIRVGKSLANKGYKVAILSNEIGEVGIDDGIVTKYGFQIRDITNGCICCTLFLNMKATLTELHNSYDPDFILVEPSGLAFADVIKQNLELMNFGDSLAVAPVVTLIDGTRFKDLMKGLRTYMLRQIGNSEILVITKVDVLDPIQVSLIEDSLKQLNPLATVLKMSLKTESAGFDEMLRLISPRVLAVKSAPAQMATPAPIMRTTTTIRKSVGSSFPYPRQS